MAKHYLRDQPAAQMACAKRRPPADTLHKITERYMSPTIECVGKQETSACNPHIHPFKSNGKNELEQYKHPETHHPSTATIHYRKRKFKRSQLLKTLVIIVAKNKPINIPSNGETNIPIIILVRPKNSSE